MTKTKWYAKPIYVFVALALVLSFSLVTAVPVAADTLNVGPGQTYTTIQAAIDAASPGDTINVAAGTYDESINIPSGKDGLKILGEGKDTTTISSTTSPTATVVTVGSPVTISGFTIKGSEASLPDETIRIDVSGSPESPGVIEGNRIEGLIPSGAYASIGFLYNGGVGYWEITGNEFTATKTGIAFNITTHHITVSGNTFIGYLAACGSTDNTQNVTITGNQFLGSSEAGSEAIGIASVTNLTIENNLIQGNDNGIKVWGGGNTNIVVSGNTFTNNDVQVSDGPGALVIQDVLDNNTFDRAVVVRGSPIIKVPTIFSSIQDAVNAAVAGDIVDVAAGTYQEAITIDKTLTLMAASKPVIDCSDRAGLGLAKTDGCIEVTADNVTIQGFKLIGYDPTGESWSDKWSSSNFATIKLTSGADGLKVDGNEFVAPDGGTATVGLLIHNDGGDDGGDNVEFTGNTITNYGQCVVGHANVDNLLVQNNTFSLPIIEKGLTGADARAYGYGVQLWWGDNLQVKGNTFVGSWDTATGNYEDPDALCNHYAVTTFATYYAPYWDAPDRVCDMYIEDNEMTNLYLGIGSFAGGGTVKDNDIHDNLLGLQLGQVSGTWATAPTAGLSITGNDIESNKRGIWAQSFELDGIAAHFNNIVGNTDYGVLNEDPENDGFDATCNWWDDASGPSGGVADPVTGTLANGTGDAVSSNVIFVPWLLSEDGPCLGGLTPAQLKEEARTELNSIYPTGDKKVDKGLEKAIKHLDKSMDEDLWVGDTHLDKKHGAKVFNEEKKTVKELMHLIDKKDTPDEVKDVCQLVIDKLIEADKLLAATAYEDAQAEAGYPKVDKELEKCDKEFEKAEKELAKGKYDKAIKHYKNAWKHAQKALGKAPEDDEEP